MRLELCESWVMTESPRNIDGLGHDELKALVVEVLEKFFRLKEENASLREEIARLKGLKGRPDIKPGKPSGMEQASHQKSSKGSRSSRRRGSTRAKLKPEIRKIKVANVPAGSRFKGYESFLVQDVKMLVECVLYRRERWELPDCSTLLAPLPEGVTSHFGAELKRLALSLYHHGQTTVPRLFGMLRDFGIDISKRQLQRLLNRGHEAFHDEAREVLQAGLETASWVSVDDTGARHKAQNGVCTQIGNDQFTAFTTTRYKSRLNFLEVLNAGDATHRLNEAALRYMRLHKLPARVIDLLKADPETCFADRAAFMAHLDRLGITGLKAHPDPVRVASEGALWGNIKERGLLRNTVILSDGAGQFNVGIHAMCWVHAERLAHKLNTFTPDQLAAKEDIRSRIWALYVGLKAYGEGPTPEAKAELSQRFDTIFSTKTCFSTLNGLLKRLKAHKSELLMVLDRPETPLNTNGSENCIRAPVTRRKVSGGTRSDQGRDCRDTFLSLMKTCAKRGIRFWDYFGDRLKVPGAPSVPRLADLVRRASSECAEAVATRELRLSG